MTATLHPSGLSGPLQVELAVGGCALLVGDDLLDLGVELAQRLPLVFALESADVSLDLEPAGEVELRGLDLGHVFDRCLQSQLVGAISDAVLRLERERHLAETRFRYDNCHVNPP